MGLSNAFVPFACVRCGLKMNEGTYVNGGGPYCPHCVPQNPTSGDYCLYRKQCPYSRDCEQTPPLPPSNLK
jgi:hypothetical protein